MQCQIKTQVAPEPPENLKKLGRRTPHHAKMVSKVNHHPLLHLHQATTELTKNSTATDDQFMHCSPTGRRAMKEKQCAAYMPSQARLHRMDRRT